MVRTIDLVAQSIPRVAAHADEIREGLQKGLAENQSKITAAYALTLAELRKPIRDDGITNIVEAVGVANSQLRIGSRFAQRMAQSFIRGELDDPSLRPRLPGLLRTLIATLEGNA